MANCKQYEFGDLVFTQVNKSTARKLYNDGEMIYVIPSRVNRVSLDPRPESRLRTGWIKPATFHISEQDYADFDKCVNHYEYYNCTNNTVGTYAHYFTCRKKGELIK